MSGERLHSAAAALAHQRTWFQGLRTQVQAGSPLALANADAPHEVLRAMGIPYVVNQWWSSVIAAKGGAHSALDALEAAGLPTGSQYDALPLGAQMLPADDVAWGGLPAPSFAIAERGGDVTHKIFERWGRRTGTETYLLSRTGAVPAPEGWWELAPHRWEEVFGSDRIDLLQAEIEGLVAWLEVRTGRVFDPRRLAHIMDLANEQAEWNRRTRDMLATARPLPVAVGDIIPAVMVPQWHRGTSWAVAAARSLHDEVAARIDAHASASGPQRRRLMWIGRGLWGDLAMYRAFEEEFGAVFVWSMYLAIAADGYARYGSDPIRTLAARFVGLTDLLYVPPMSSSWYRKEALAHGVDGVVHLVADDTPGSALITEALEAEGIPVLEVRGSNADPAVAGTLHESIRSFLRERVRPGA